MAMYIYQAYLAKGITPENAKLYTAQEIEKLYNEYTGQAGITRPLPKRALPLAQELHRYITEGDNQSMYMKVLKGKSAELLDAIKKG